MSASTFDSDQIAREPQPDSRRAVPDVGQVASRDRRTVSRLVAWLSWINLAVVIVACGLVCIISERWWISTVLMYLPRVPWLIPAAVLAVASAFVRRRMIAVNFVAIVLVAGPMMGFSFAHGSARDFVPSGPALHIVSCNVQNGLSSLPKLLVEFDRCQPDVLVLQETKHGVEELERRLADWQGVHVGEFWIASRWPVRLVSECHAHAFGRRSAILCEIDSDNGPVLVGSIHLNTLRYALSELRWHSPLTDAGLDALNEFQLRRTYEMKETRSWLNECANGRPVILAGDFNTPTSSSMFQPVWGDLTSGFEAACSGYGFTAPCNTDRLWPPNTPWARIDHLLCSPEWSVRRFEIGRTNGSDHRLICVELQRSAPEPERP